MQLLARVSIYVRVDSDAGRAVSSRAWVEAPALNVRESEIDVRSGV